MRRCGSPETLKALNEASRHLATSGLPGSPALEASKARARNISAGVLAGMMSAFISIFF
jgi:hypothetical protein